MVHPPIPEIKFSKTHWDCECDNDFFRPNSQTKCYKCGALKEEQPPSRLNEIEAHLSGCHNDNTIIAHN